MFLHRHRGEQGRPPAGDQPQHGEPLVRAVPQVDPSSSNGSQGEADRRRRG